MFCKQCEEDNPNNAKFCSRCGSVLKNTYINSIHRTQKERNYKWVYILSICVSVIVSFSFFLNLGWYRAISIMAGGLCFGHLALYYITNIRSAPFLKKNKLLTMIMIIQNITYSLYHFLWPDSGDVGGAYAFFGQIRFDESRWSPYLNDFQNVALILSVIHFVCLITQFIIVCIIRNRKNK